MISPVLPSGREILVLCGELAELELFEKMERSGVAAAELAEKVTETETVPLALSVVVCWLPSGRVRVTESEGPPAEVEGWGEVDEGGV